MVANKFEKKESNIVITRTVGCTFGEMVEHNNSIVCNDWLLLLYKVFSYATGIGNGIAKALAAGGAETVAMDIIQDNLDKLKSEVILH